MTTHQAWNYHHHPRPPRKKWPWVLGGVVGGIAVLCCGAVVTLLGLSLSEPTQVAATDEPVRDGKFEFEVTKVETDITQVGTERFNEVAQGQFVLVYVTVTNTGDQSQVFDSAWQRLFDSQGREHSSSAVAELHLPEAESYLNEINPGNSVDGILVFDIPTGATPASIRLHDSSLSGGVQVKLD